MKLLNMQTFLFFLPTHISPHIFLSSPYGTPSVDVLLLMPYMSVPHRQDFYILLTDCICVGYASK